MKQKKKLLRQLPLIILVTVLLCCTTSNALTVPQIAKKALAATIYLEMQDNNGTVISRGSGFFVQSNLIATNYHVIEGAARGTAKLVDRYRTYTIEGITATDKTNDLVLLKVSVYGINPLPLGDSNTVRIGEKIYVAGNPLGLEGTVSDGIISSRRDRYTKERLQMTAPISPGSSGGPVLNRKGKVIGVSVATFRALEAQNLNFAIPSNYLKALLNRSGIAKPFSQQSQFISADTYFRRGNDKTRMENYQGAIADYTRAIRLKPDDANAYYNRGNAKRELGQHFAAIADYDTTIRLKPDDALAYLNRGLAKSGLGQHFTAIADYDMAIRLKPDYGIAYASRGLAKSVLGQHFTAIADYDTAIHLRPDYAFAYLNRGLAKSSLGQHFAAIADFDTGIRLQPDDATAYLHRGLAKADIGQHSAAIADYDTAIHLKPDYAFAYLNRGLAKGQLKRFWEARQDLRIALTLAKQNGDESLKSQIEKTLQLIDMWD